MTSSKKAKKGKAQMPIKICPKCGRKMTWFSSTTDGYHTTYYCTYCGVFREA